MTQEWYQTYAHGMSDELLFQVLTAANYMEIQPLLDLACLRVTFQLQGKSAEEVCLLRSEIEVFSNVLTNATLDHLFNYLNWLNCIRFAQF
jgi:hypothetical protein